MNRLTNSRRCFACRRKLKLKDIGYEPNTLKSYHMNYDRCLDAYHPNSPEMQRNRGGKEILLPGKPDEFFQAIQKIYPKNILYHIKRLTAKTAAFRPTPPQVMHMLKVQEYHDCRSINETIGFIIDEHLKEHSKEYGPELPKEINWERKRKIEPEPSEPEPEPQLDPLEPEPEPEPKEQEDDEFVI